MPPFTRAEGWTNSDVSVHLLDGEPPAGFDCGREMQNDFLYRHAWEDQQAGASVTRLFLLNGMLAGYATVAMDSLVLTRPERDPELRFATVGAMKLAQLGVDLRFAGRGLGTLIVAYAIRLARDLSARVGCRYLTLDAQPDLVGWYTAFGFVPNKTMQERRIQDATAHRRPVEDLAVSMRFDLRAPGE
jgi:GNAT superfamily N-acetyltransferase